ncbi:hypothetical protein [uncultured Sulfitobacter sp.]|jgi:hypothetical protein|uniref:hypothetical protein n=1 Tax=Sulfitobacter sp. SH22 TaxID=3421172 RepID=UPI0025F64F11|nr:hypothetical protein [uncultured Sulfitobacter sp.]
MSIRPSFGAVVPDKNAYQADLGTKITRAAPLRLEVDGPISLDEPWRYLWPTRDQFGRGTCVAFGTIAAIELLRAREMDMPPERLSEQFLHEQMLSQFPLALAEIDTMPEGGSLLRQAWQVIENRGVLDADKQPYRPAAHGIGPSGPRAAADLEAAADTQRFTCLSYGRVGHPKDGDDPRTVFFSSGDEIALTLLNYLKDGYPVVIGIPLFLHPSGLTNWTLPSVLAQGRVHCPDDADAPALEGPRDDGHVICLTGFIPDAAEPLGGWFTFRNSWGTEFAARALGDAAPVGSAGRGNGILSATHVNAYCWEYLVPGPGRDDQPATALPTTS